LCAADQNRPSYAVIAKCATYTALRDTTELLAHGVL
jgi:hypothetical protein